MKDKKISLGKTLALGILLFSMFFGSGNLIFPPYMGFLAGTKTWLGMAGFAITAIIFPVLGVIAIAKNDNLMKLAGRVNTKFALIFSIIVFLALGPGLAIPRNAAVSFEMAVVPFVRNVTPFMRIAYSLIFFIISFLLSVHPEKLIDWLGKVLGPILLVLMLLIAAACFINAPGGLALPSGSYASGQMMQGFMDGYNTMDTLAALNFGNIIALNIMSEGIKDKKEIVNYTKRAGVIAGILLFVIYAVLAYVGALSGGSFPNASNGANVLTNIVFYLFGNKGIILLGIIYVLSCMTTCVGLLCSCAEYFASISKIKYEIWVLLFAIGGFAFSVAGLDKLLAVSVPFLNGVYPIAMVLVILGICGDKLKKYPAVYGWTVGITTIVSIIYGLHSAGIDLPYLTAFILNISPVSDLCWLLPAVIGAGIGLLISKLKRR